MANEVSIRVTADDDVSRGFSQVRRKVASMLRTVGREYKKGGEEHGGSLGKGMLKGLKAAFHPALLKAVAAGAGSVLGAQLITALGAALVSGATKLAKGFGAALALLPAAALAGAAALGSLKIALSGVGDALSAGLSGDTEAFNEALEGLSPSAKAVARGIVGLRDRFGELKQVVQESFFEPLVGRIRPLVEAYLPQTESLLASIAQRFGRAANAASGFLRIDSVVKSLSGAFDDAGVAVGNLVGPLGLLPQILAPLVTVGASFLPQLTEGFGSAAARAASFMQEAQRTGQLHQFIQSGIDSIRSLIDTGKQLGRIFQNIGGIISTVWGAAGLETTGLLDTIEKLTGKADRFLKSAQGGSALAQIFGVLREVGGNFMDTLGRIGELLADVFGPIMPEIGDFLVALSELRASVMDVGLDALEPILMGIGTVLGTIVLPALTGLATWLAENQPVLQGIGIAIMTFLVPAFLAWAINAGVAAAATLAAMAPVILIGAAIAGLAALVIIHFDTIVGVFKAAWNWLAENWPLLLAILAGPFGIAVLLIIKHWDKIKSAAATAKNFVTGKFDDLVSFVTGLPGRIASAASGMFSGITGAFKSAINGIIDLWNGLSFPSLTVGGQDPLGSFGPSLPRVTIGGWDLPNIPRLAHGGIRGGLTQINERGREIVDLPQGSRVIPAGTSNNMLAGGTTVNVSVTVTGSVVAQSDLERVIVGTVRDAANNGAFRGAFRGTT